MRYLIALALAATCAYADIGPWCGAVTTTSAVVKMKSTTVDKLTVEGQEFPVARSGEIATFTLTGLEPDHLYTYQIGPNTGSFRTFPQGQASFKFVFASCGHGNNLSIYDTINRQNPLFYMNVGDLHYANINENDPVLYRQAYDQVFGGESYARLFRQTPFVYTWDDHDFGPDNSDSHSPGRFAARLAYQEYLPHYPLAAGTRDVPIYQTFEVGRVKFIVTDTRSERSPSKSADGPQKTMLGAQQKAWLKQELLAANGRYPLIFWVSSVTWIGKPKKGDLWSAYATERREIANFIKDNHIRGVCILCGDAHSVAADDGTNSDYADGGGAPIPVLLSSPLDSRPNSKGGPYSQGVYVPARGEGLYGLVAVTDLGDKIQVTFSARNQDDVERLRFEFAVTGSE